MKRETGLRSLILLAILVLSGISLWPTVLVFSKGNDTNLPLEQREREIYKRENPTTASKALNLGLDLAGGTHIVVEIDRSKLDESASRDVLERSLEIIRNRVDQYGLSEPVITRSGDDRIIASLAGMGAEDARRLIGATALLEFKLVAELEEFQPILNRLDAHLARQQGHVSDQETGGSETSEFESVFGRVVRDDDTSRVADSGMANGDALTADAATDTSLDDTATGQLFDPEARPFSAMLVQIGRDIGVEAENYERARRFLDNREVRQLIPTRYQFLWGRETEQLDDGREVRRLYLLYRRAEMTGSTIADATFQHVQGGMQAGEIEVGLTFQGIGPNEFARITGANIGKQLAIVLDSVVYSAPVIQGRIPNGRASITGLGSITEAKQLAVVLRAGALPAPMNIVELRSVGPTLGEENIRKGLFAAAAALLLVALFMAWYYRMAGLFAVLALLINMIVVFAVLSAFGATLTLPGLAGIALTIGMAVDANVLIFERIREELKAGKSARIAVDTGYRKALSAILDANITTFGTAAILYYIGIGPIKGFGLTLMIGLAASMYTALVVTRLFFDYRLRRMEVREVNIGKGVPWLASADIKVVPAMRYYVGFALLIAFISVGSLGVRGLNLGIDFTGGHVYQVQYDESPDVEALRASVAGAGFSQPRVQSFGPQSEHRVLVYLQDVGGDTAALAAIREAVAPGTIESEDAVGASVGRDLRWAAIWSLVTAVILIILYIWIRFGRNGLGFGIAATMESLAASLATIGFFSLFGMEMNLPFIAAVLTVIGYSLNDAIVIFDRVREQSNLTGNRDSFGTRVNNAANQCLSRSVITHVTTIFTLLTLVVLGGSSIRDFAAAMLIGITIGGIFTYAVACPFVVWWDSRRIRVKKAA